MSNFFSSFLGYAVKYSNPVNMCMLFVQIIAVSFTIFVLIKILQPLLIFWSSILYLGRVGYNIVTFVTGFADLSPPINGTEEAFKVLKDFKDKIEIVAFQ